MRSLPKPSDKALPINSLSIWRCYECIYLDAFSNSKAFCLLLFIRQLTGKLGTTNPQLLKSLALFAKYVLSAYKAGYSADILMAFYCRYNIMGMQRESKDYHCWKTLLEHGNHKDNAQNYGMLGRPLNKQKKSSYILPNNAAVIIILAAALLHSCSGSCLSFHSVRRNAL